ncbi:hypothetical protein OC846_003080 [Tilletia horrida]|uniref:Uncharacterized protein n=1 Tax=Tilletia horrida TaxID=155126 RepID=A0AAN6GPQ7_9BASI|nr:hypothetical protein OC845_002805 [Tilletia horrida]KAK0551996.1 hypothetical protein OC846_003080 [Tilletia horrida]KAK0566159.1 hypothetical protein OC861_003380 [Tilletia horrida]
MFRVSSLFAFVLVAALAVLASSAVGAASSPTSKAAKIAGAQAYVAAVVSHSEKDINSIPMADNITRFENLNGSPLSQTANGSVSLKKSLRYGTTAFFVAGSAGPGNYTVLKNGTVSSVYRLKAGLLGIPFTETQVFELFDYTKSGLIYNITAYAVAPPPKA